MKRPWQVWSVFAATLLLVVVAMGWLTIKVSELARAEAEARRQEQLLTLRADFEGDVRLALRRMDLELADIFAQESAWPYFAYRSFYVPQAGQEAVVESAPAQKPGPGQGGGKGKNVAGDKLSASSNAAPIPSPLLKPPVPYVNLYFQVDEQNRVQSPNVPPKEQYELAASNGLSTAQIEGHKLRLDDLALLWKNNDLSSRLPDIQPIAAPLDRNQAPGPAVAQLPSQEGTDAERFGQQQTDQPTAQTDKQQTDKQQTDKQQTDKQQAGNQQAGNQQAKNHFDEVQLDEIPGQQGDQQAANAPVQQYQQRISTQSQTTRSNVEFENRKKQFEKYATNWNARLQQRDQLLGNEDMLLYSDLAGTSTVAGGHTAIEGRSRAMWVDSQLLLARRLLVDGKTIVQGAWLDWPTIKQRLIAQVADLLPEMDIVPVASEADGDLNRMFATLPAQLVVTPPELPLVAAAGLSPVQLSLLLAWICLLLAAVAAAVLLSGVMALSERRAAFVSAVTHELRTPLTTFRMYAEMLAEGMVPEASQRQRYLETLKTEADRLFHLVENVLSYARLERGRATGNFAQVDAGTLFDDIQRRLAERAALAEMELVVDIDERVREQVLFTDVSAVEQILVNLVDNACKYATPATGDRRIHLDVQSHDGSLIVRVRDHGPGIAASEVGRLFQPFTKSAREAAHSAPGVGLGLALCRRLSRQLGGKLWLESRPGDGACFVLKLPASSA